MATTQQAYSNMRRLPPSGVTHRHPPRSAEAGVIDTRRPVVDWQGFYEVSSQGGVWSVERLVKNRHGQRRVRARRLKETPGSDGHLRVSLHREGRATTKSVHRLVLEAFVGPCPPGMEGCHGPGGVRDNSVSNLRWDTRSANIQDAVRDGTHHQSSKAKCAEGHAYDVTWGRNGGRRCRQCENRKARDRYRARKHEQQ